MTATVHEAAFSEHAGPFLSGSGGDASWSFDDLRTTVRAIGSVVLDRGQPLRPVIAIVLPQGPLLAASLIGAMCYGTAAPLNPQSSASELEMALCDVGASLVLTLPGFCPRAERVAQQMGVPLVDCSGLSGTADDPTVGPDDVALLLHTSGTTARPKLVPLTHSNLLASATKVAATMQLTGDDRGLALMPLFHIHGIVGLLLASLVTGSQLHVVRFEGLIMQKTISDADISWLSAVPTMYQAMLERPMRMAPSRVRVARSSSATLPDKVWLRLEDRLGCPVVNSYGMTEAAHQMASTSVHCSDGSVGTVGWADGPEIGVAAEIAGVRRVGSGELVIRGPGVMTGYLRPASANDAAFVEGWFRTGDVGEIDDAGRVRLLGRLKELINVGGEKVSPFEVEDVLLAHPAVGQAAAFAMPSKRYGEEVYSVVTLVSEVDELDLRHFARQRLAKMKTPTRILIVDEIPMGPTGKVQRMQLGRQLGL